MNLVKIVTVHVIITVDKTIVNTTIKIDLIMIKMLINVVDINKIIKTITDHQASIKDSMDNNIIIINNKKVNKDSTISNSKDNKIIMETINKEINFIVQIHIIIPDKIIDKIDNFICLIVYFTLKNIT